MLYPLTEVVSDDVEIKYVGGRDPVMLFLDEDDNVTEVRWYLQFDRHTMYLYLIHTGSIAVDVTQTENNAWVLAIYGQKFSLSSPNVHMDKEIVSSKVAIKNSV